MHAACNAICGLFLIDTSLLIMEILNGFWKCAHVITGLDLGTVRVLAQAVGATDAGDSRFH